MDDTYAKYFGLSESPFNVVPDGQCLYFNRTYQQAFIALRYGIKVRLGLMVLTGDAGVGKTSLITFIKNRCEANIRLAVTSSRGRDFSDLLRFIMRSLGLEEMPAERQAMVQEIRRYLLDRVKEDYIFAVILDDAQDFNLDTLKEIECLSNLLSSDRNLLQIVLVGRPDLEKTLDNPALRSLKECVKIWSRLEPLKTEELGTYIDSRLSSAGHRNRGLFNSDAVARIAAYSNGIPGLINTICDRALYSVYTASQHHVTAATVDRVWETLHLTGETTFKVAALLSEIKHCCRRLEAQSGRDFKVQTIPEDGEQFHLNQTMSGSKDHGPARRQTSSRLEMLRDRAKPTMFSWQETIRSLSAWLPTIGDRGWTQTRVWLGGLRDRVSQKLNSGIDTVLERAPRVSRRLSVVIVVLVLGGSIGLLYNAARKNSRLESYDTLSISERNSQLDIGGRQDAEMPQKGEMVQPPEMPHLAQGRTVGDKSPIQMLVPHERATTPVSHQSAPIVYVHTSEERDRFVLEEIGNVLRVNGYTVRDTRFTPNKTQGDVRFFFTRDRRAAERVMSVVQSELAKRGYSVSLQLMERDGKKFQFAAPGKIELWLPPLPHLRQLG
jgi:general secretion pathway protein A